MWNGSFGSEGVSIGTEDVWGKYDPTTALNALKSWCFGVYKILQVFLHTECSIPRNLLQKAGYKGYV